MKDNPLGLLITVAFIAAVLWWAGIIGPNAGSAIDAGNSGRGGPAAHPTAESSDDTFDSGNGTEMVSTGCHPNCHIGG